MKFNPSSVWVCAGLGEAALDFALPVGLIIADRKPELDVVLDARSRIERVVVAVEGIVERVQLRAGCRIESVGEGRGLRG